MAQTRKTRPRASRAKTPPKPRAAAKPKDEKAVQAPEPNQIPLPENGKLEGTLRLGRFVLTTVIEIYNAETGEKEQELPAEPISLYNLTQLRQFAETQFPLQLAAMNAQAQQAALAAAAAPETEGEPGSE